MVSSENPFPFPSLPTSPPPAPATLLPILEELEDGQLRPLLRSEAEYHAHCFVQDAWAVARRLILSKISLYAIEAHIAVLNPDDRSLEAYDMNDRLRDFFTGNQPQLVVSKMMSKFAEIRPNNPGRILINHNTVELGKIDYKNEEHYYSSYPRHVLWAAVLIAHEMVEWGAVLLGYTAAIIIDSPADLARAWENEVFGGRLAATEIGIGNMYSCKYSTYFGDITSLYVEAQSLPFTNHRRYIADSIVNKIVTTGQDWESHLPIRGAWRRKSERSGSPQSGLWLNRELGPGPGRGLLPLPGDQRRRSEIERLHTLFMRTPYVPPERHYCR